MITSVVRDIRKEWDGLVIRDSTLLHFGLLLAGGCGAGAGMLLWRGDPRWFLPAAAGMPILLAVLFSRRVLRGPFRCWMLAGLIIGWFMTRVMLTLAYMVLVAPLGCLLRAMGKDLLDERIERAASSYWKRPEADGREQRYRKQF